MKTKICIGLLGVFLLTVQRPCLATGYKLSVPTETRLVRMEDFRGVLLTTADGVLQVEAVVWQIHADGALDIGEFKGFNDRGERIEVSRVADDARVVSAAADFQDFYLGAQGNPELVWVRRAVLGTDSEGFLRIIELYGREVSTDTEIDYVSSPSEACGLRTVHGCRQGNCTGNCGAYPACSCSAPGNCEGYTETVCSDDCPENWICNGSVVDCRCVKDVPTLTEWGLIVLVALFIGSAVCIILRRKKATTSV